MKKHGSIFNLFLAATFIVLLFGCKKGLTEKEAESTGKRKASTESLTPPDVYVVGNENNQAKVWKNGVGTVLPGGQDATGIAVVGTDVHICGTVLDPTTFNRKAVYWKNGVPTVLSDGSQEIIPMGIAVSGTNVYIASRVGLFLNESMYFHNGVAHSLGFGYADGVTTDANGHFYIPNAQGGSPSYWLDGTTVVPLQQGTPTHSTVRALAVQGGTVYAAGHDRVAGTDKALYWLNGVAQPVVQQFNSQAMAIAVTSTGQAVMSGISGQDPNNQHLTYWSAVGDPQTLSSGRWIPYTTGIAVDATSDEVYVCGSETETSNGPIKAKYWHISNSGGVQSFTLNTGSSEAFARAIALGY
jgi:hypothetical protein